MKIGTMPTYDYHCPKCKATYELRQGFDAETTHTCEECGKGIAKRVLHAPRVVFKGSGWYVTDSKGRSAAAKDGNLEGAAAADGDAAAAAPSESSEPAKKAVPKAKAETSGSTEAAAAS